MPPPAESSFSPGVDRWTESLGRLRDVVRQELVAEQLAATVAPSPGAIPTPALRVLDVGCGQGTQALRLARAGHQVTGVDASSVLLDRFAADLAAEEVEVRIRVRLVCGPGEAAPDLVSGPFDLVLCHGVLMYLDDPTAMLTALSAVAGEDAALSLLVRNGLAMAMRDGLRGDWASALAAFDTTSYVNRLGLAARAHTPADLDRALEPFGWTRARWFGVRVLSDHRDDPAPAPAELPTLLAAEAEAARRDPYRSVAALLHLIYRR